ncbi:MAG TPA: hypothetical protein VMU53_00055 [Candidatus Sulfotelmatobacter sp.]|nr:hypothetical protein [Candidatus Sulfotelmatobacter sp.]
MIQSQSQDNQPIHRILSGYYKTPAFFTGAVHCDASSNGSGFFRLGPDIVCYGECSTGVTADVENSGSCDAYRALQVSKSGLHLPFHIDRVIDDLRMEHYVRHLNADEKRLVQSKIIRRAYYLVRAPLPIWVRRHLQRAYFRDWQKLSFPHWPVDSTVDSLHELILRLAMQAQGCRKVPFIWFWPKSAAGCVILTHDVETTAGRDFVPTLMDMDQAHGFRASFQVVPEKRYEITDKLVREIQDRGFEFNIHDLNHDGHLFEDKNEFLLRVAKINKYGKKYGARGFRSGAMYRNQDWLDAFDFSYDMSVPNVAHFEPQRGGCCTVMPYFNGRILELPLTTSQDYTVFHILNERVIDLWKKQIKLIRDKNGLLSFLSHPDYLIDSQCRAVYNTLLAHLRQLVDQDGLWTALPSEVDRWWRARSNMKLVPDGTAWRIEGPESEQASVAYAMLDGDRIIYALK